VTAHQNYLANFTVQQNGGQADTSNPSSTRHCPPANVTGNYHNTASSLSQMMTRHTYSTVQGALLAAQDGIKTGRTAPTLIIQIVQEQMSLNAGREMVESMHGDSVFAQPLAVIAKAAGPPTTFTNLPGDGSLFNTRSIPSCNSQHLQVNNRLEPMPGSRPPRNALYPPGVNQPSKSSKDAFGPAICRPCIGGTKRGAIASTKNT